MTRQLKLAIITLLIGLPTLLLAQGWRGSVNGQEIFYGTVAKPNVDGADLGDTTHTWDIFSKTFTLATSACFPYTDAKICRDAANVLGQRNSTTAQSFYVYNTYTDASNYERGGLSWATNALTIGATKAGTGTARALTLEGSAVTISINTSALWDFNGSGHFVPRFDNTSDLGAATFQVRNGYFGTAVKAPTVNATTGYQNSGVAQIYYTTSNFTTAANTSLQTITGLTWQLPLNTVLNVPFSCKLTYSQATAVVPISFGLQTDTLTPTNFQGMGQMETALTTVAFGDAKVTNTTATTIVTGTPSAITTIWNAYIDGFIENPSGAATNINVMAQTSNASDLVTVYRDSWCRVF